MANPNLTLEDILAAIAPRGVGGGYGSPPTGSYAEVVDEPVPQRAPQFATVGNSGGDYRDRLALALSKIQIPANDFGSGFLGGVAQGFSGGRVKQMSEKDKLNEALRAEAVRQNERNFSASQAAKTLRAHQVERALDRAREMEKDARENVAVPADPNLPAWLTGKTVPTSTVYTTAMNAPGKDAAAARADAAAARAEANAERANRIGQANVTGKIADDYHADTTIKGYQNLRTNIKTAEAAIKQGTGPGDVALVFSFMRALEPDNPNAVREGEYKNARDAVGALQKYKNSLDRFVVGTQFTPEGRAQIINMMRGALKERRGDFESRNDQYRRRGVSGGVDPTEYLLEYPASDTAAVAPRGQFVRDPATGKLVRAR